MKVKLPNFLGSLKGIGSFFKKEWKTISISIASLLVVSVASIVTFLPNELANVRVDGRAINQLEYSDRYIATKNIYALLGYDVDDNAELQGFVKKNVVYKMVTEEYEKIIAKELGVSYSKSDVEKFLSENGYSEVLFNNDVSYKMAKGDYLSILNKGAIVSEVVGSEEKIKEYYEANKEKFQSTKTKMTEQLVFTDKEMAEKVLVEIQKGKSLQEFEGEGAIFVNANVSESDTKVSEFVSQLSKGEVSNVVSFGGNYFIIKSLDDSYNGVELEFEDVKDRVVDEIIKVEAVAYYNTLIQTKLADKKVTFN